MEIPIHGGYTAFIDEESFPLVSSYKWYLHKANPHVTYAQGYHPVTKERVLMHRVVMQSKKGQYIDHRNKNGLDNRLCNLRFATSSQNTSYKNSALNSSSRFLGVTFHKKANKWVAHIAKYGKLEYLGLFSNETDAALAYNKRAVVLHGEFANLNVIP